MERSNFRFAVLAVGCWMILTLLAPQVSGQEPEPSGGSERAARLLADDLVTKMRHSEKQGQLVALEPLRADRFLDLDERRRQQLYDLLMGSLRSEVAGSYDMVNPSRFESLSRTIEETGGMDWFDRYLRIVGDAGAQISISCRAGPARQGRFTLFCSADSVEPYRNLVSAQREFEKEWLTGPVDPAWAIASIAEAVVEHMQGSGRLGAVSIEDAETGSATVLSTHFADMLRDEVSEKLRARTGLRPVEEGPGQARYRAAGTIRRYEDRMEVRVELYAGDGDYPETTFREKLHWTNELEELSSAAVKPSGPGPECGPDDEIGQRRLADGTRLADWVLLADDLLRTGTANYSQLIVESTKLLADHCDWLEVKKILDAAVSAVENELAAVIAGDARAGLERLLLVEAAAGRHLGLIRLRAQAHASLKEYRKEERAYAEWLELAPDTPPHPDRLEVLRAQRRLLVLVAAEDGEAALALDARSRQLVRQGLASEGFAGGEGSAEFGGVFRGALSAWQAAKGFPETGYLDAGQAQSLMAIARARMAAEEGEQRLELNSEARMLVERGLASWRTGGGRVDGTFDTAFRAVLRSWQAENGHAVTGFLTESQSDTLSAVGLAEKVREEDDAAFREAVEANTAAAYLAYLKAFPDGLHRAEAEQRHAEAAAREEMVRARQAIEEEERALSLSLEDSMLIQQGLDAWAEGTTPVGAKNGTFHEAFRQALREWQDANGYDPTGYLDAEQAGTLIAVARSGLLGGPGDLADFGDDSGQWANNGECDDPRFVGDGMADSLLVEDMGRDASDCRSLLERGQIQRHPLFGNPEDPLDFGDDSGRWAHDSECDDARFVGIGVAEALLAENMGRDASDCQALFELGRIRLRPENVGLEPSLENSRSGNPGSRVDYGDDSSHWANDGECDDPRFVGDGMAGTLLAKDEGRDASDCQALFELGRIRLRPENEGLEPSLENSRSGNTGGRIDYGDDSSRWANDGECDDPRFVGVGMAGTLLAKDEGRDASDCQALFELGRIRLRPENEGLEPSLESSRSGNPGGRINYGDDSSHWANDGECDDPRFVGDGMAEALLVEDMGRDAADCRHLFELGRIRVRPEDEDLAASLENSLSGNLGGTMDFGDNGSQWANDGECDDPRFVGDGMADSLLVEDMGRDAADCRHLFELGLIRLHPLVGSDALIDQLVPVTGGTAETRKVDLQVEFRFGSAKLTERAVAQLHALGEALVSEALREAAVGIYGHTDATGPAEFNQNLSESRAQSVAAFLRERFDMDQSRFREVRGYGESRLRTDLSPDAPAQRRVEIAIFHLDFGDDSSQWANDGECDDPRFAGDGMAAQLLVEDTGRDAADCRHLFELGRIRLRSEIEGF